MKNKALISMVFALFVLGGCAPTDTGGGPSDATASNDTGFDWAAQQQAQASQDIANQASAQAAQDIANNTIQQAQQQSLDQQNAQNFNQGQ
jgi:hypothetical protein